MQCNANVVRKCTRVATPILTMATSGNVVFARVLVQNTSRFFLPSFETRVLTSLLQFTYLWYEDIQSHAIIEKQLKWAPATVVEWKNFMRDIYVEEIIDDPEPLDGPGVIVEIDDSKFGRRKYNLERLVEGTWVECSARQNQYMLVAILSHHYFFLVAISHQWLNKPPVAK